MNNSAVGSLVRGGNENKGPVVGGSEAASAGSSPFAGLFGTGGRRRRKKSKKGKKSCGGKKRGRKSRKSRKK